MKLIYCLDTIDLKTEKQIYQSMVGEMKRLRSNNAVSQYNVICIYIPVYIVKYIISVT